MISNLAESRRATLAAWQEMPPRHRVRIAGLAGYLGILTLAFVQPLVALFVHAREHSLHSHIPLVPLITAYLLFVRPRSIAESRPSIAGASLAAMAGVAALAAAAAFGEHVSLNDRLALQAFAYLGLVTAGLFLFLGTQWMAAAAFPIAFLVFIVPMPDGVAYWLERGSVLASADVAAWLFRITGTPLLQDGTILALPGIVLEVAQECSGIRSSWVLFITSLVASNMFLKSPWRRLILVTFVIPLAIVRNATRILVIGLLCVHIGPHMIDSMIHRQGGPVFFALSLIPLFLVLWWLYRQEHRGAAAG